MDFTRHRMGSVARGAGPDPPGLLPRDARKTSQRRFHARMMLTDELLHSPPGRRSHRGVQISSSSTATGRCFSAARWAPTPSSRPSRGIGCRPRRRSSSGPTPSFSFHGGGGHWFTCLRGSTARQSPSFSGTCAPFASTRVRIPTKWLVTCALFARLIHGASCFRRERSSTMRRYPASRPLQSPVAVAYAASDTLHGEGEVRRIVRCHAIRRCSELPLQHLYAHRGGGGGSRSLPHRTGQKDGVTMRRMGFLRWLKILSMSVAFSACCVPRPPDRSRLVRQEADGGGGGKAAGVDGGLRRSPLRSRRTRRPGRTADQRWNDGFGHGPQIGQYLRDQSGQPTRGWVRDFGWRRLLVSPCRRSRSQSSCRQLVVEWASGTRWPLPMGASQKWRCDRHGSTDSCGRKHRREHRGSESPARVDGGDNWWPCKDHPSDEPDEGMDIALTVPVGLVGLSNGRLIDEVDNGDGTVSPQTGGWTTRSTTTWWLSTSRPTSGSRSAITGSTGLSTSPWFSGRCRSTSEHARIMWRQMPRILEVLGRRFGEYPFFDDKFAVAHAPYYGMEHQTVVAYGALFTDNDYGFDDLLLHEVAHEWWGNKITVSDWADFWIQEGFATYAEALYVLDTLGEARYLEYMASRRQRISDLEPLVRGKNLTSSQAYTDDIYFKGAWVLHTLQVAAWRRGFLWTLSGALPTIAITHTVWFRATTSRSSSSKGERSVILIGFGSGTFTWASEPVWRLTRRLAGDRERITITWDDPDFELPLPVWVAGEEQRLEMVGGRASFWVKRSTTIEVDPLGQVLAKPVSWSCCFRSAWKHDDEDTETDENNGADDLTRDAFEGVIRQQVDRVLGCSRAGYLFDDSAADGVEGADDGAAGNQPRGHQNPSISPRLDRLVGVVDSFAGDEPGQNPSEQHWSVELHSNYLHKYIPPPHPPPPPSHSRISYQRYPWQE